MPPDGRGASAAGAARRWSRRSTESSTGARSWPMGRGMVIGVLKQIRTRLGKEPGDTVTVTLVVDDEPRRVDVPADLRAALGGRRACSRASTRSRTRTAASTCSGSRTAKRPATRQRRVEQTVERVGPTRRIVT